MKKFIFFPIFFISDPFKAGMDLGCLFKEKTDEPPCGYVFLKLGSGVCLHLKDASPLLLEHNAFYIFFPTHQYKLE